MSERDRSVRGWNLRNEDDAAAAMVCHHTGGTARKVDPGGGAHQLHDYDIDLSDGRAMALEVTQHIDFEETRTLSEIQKRTWRADHLERSWSVGTIGALNVTNLHRDLPVLLRALDTEGCWRWISTQRSAPPENPC